MTINLTINNKIIQAQENLTVLEAAHDNGIVIPTLCYHKDLSPVGSCRFCVVEVDNLRGQVSACNLPVKNGMVVRTETGPLQQSRRSVLSLLLRNYQDSGQANHTGIETEFEYWLRYYGITLPEGKSIPLRYTVDNDPNPFIHVDFNKCILCTRCVRACAEIQGRFAWGEGGR